MIKPKIKTPILRKLLIITSIVVVALAVLGQVVLDAYMYRNIVYPGGQNSMINFVINSIDNLRVPAPIDPKTGDVYLPEAHLVLPPRPDSTMQLLYNDNSSAEDGTNTEVTTRTILSRAESRLWSAQAEGTAPGWHHDPMAMFNQVPNLQACARGVQIFSKPQTQNRTFRLKETKQVADGRTLYMYTESTCQFDLTALTNYINQVQSY